MSDFQNTDKEYGRYRRIERCKIVSFVVLFLAISVFVLVNSVITLRKTVKAEDDLRKWHGYVAEPSYVNWDIMTNIHTGCIVTNSCMHIVWTGSEWAMAGRTDTGATNVVLIWDVVNDS